MKTNRFLVAAVALSLAAVGITLRAQTKGLSKEAGEVGLGLALRHLANAGIFLYAGAHPDDENNGLLVMLERGQGYRTALFTATRGSGGQNEIGPELFEALACCAPRSLAPVHRFDGSRAVLRPRDRLRLLVQHRGDVREVGPDEEMLGDYVRMIRMIRPTSS